MFATKEDQRLYLVPWEYNSMRVLGCLAKIVQDNGGDVEPWRHCMANNRTCEPTAEPKRIFGQSWINYILDDMYYHISLNDNPFMDMTIIKTRWSMGSVSEMYTRGFWIGPGCMIASSG